MAYGSTLQGILGGGSYRANAVRFDGSSTYLSKASKLTSDTSSKVLSLSFWVYKSGTGGDYNVSSTDGTGAIIFIDSSERINITASNDAGSTILIANTVSPISLSTWTHIGISVDMANTSNRVIAFDGVSQSASWSVYTDDSIGFTNSSGHVIGAAAGGVSKFDGDMSDLWEYHGGSFMDFSDSAVYEKFVNSVGKPVSLGVGGNIPTGTSPIIFMSGGTADWYTNKGTGGGFTELGTLTTATTSPSD